MILDNERESSNIEDRRRSGGIVQSGGKIGLGTIALALVAMYFGVDPNLVINGMGALETSSPQAQTANQPANDEMTKFVSMVLADTEDTWHDLFAKMGKKYEDPKLVLFSGATPTACGTGQSAMGPFYCPADHKIYIDLTFYQELKNRFHAPGEFAQAYVIAHEVGHHVQNILGISDKVQAMRQQANSEADANALSVKLELQADCLAGVWAFHANRARSILEQGDVESAINAATAIGDDNLQKQSQGYAVPESFTHGSSAQRVAWFTRGIQQGEIKLCNTFAG